MVKLGFNKNRKKQHNILTTTKKFKTFLVKQGVVKVCQNLNLPFINTYNK